MKSLIRLLIGITILASGSVVNADGQRKDNAQTGMWLLSKYDSNGDRVISSAEIAYKREKMFGYMDSDQDGIVSFEEYQGLDTRKRELLLKARFQKLDFDHDGELSADEYGSYLGSFERFDSNGDGNISAAEIGSVKSAKATEQEEVTTHCILWLCVRSKL